MIRIYKQFVSLIVSALMALMITYGGYGIYANSLSNQDGDDFREAFDIRGIEQAFQFAKNNYHKELNNFFNEKLEEVYDILDKEKLLESEEDKKRFNAPEESDSGDIDCPEDNLSSYCVSLQALDIYVEYVFVLNNVKTKLPFRPGVSQVSKEGLLQSSAAVSGEIDKEIEEARKVLESTVSVYNEYRLALPMHKEYEKVVENLIEYKRDLRDIHQEVARFPSKFHDATSAECK